MQGEYIEERKAEYRRRSKEARRLNDPESAKYWEERARELEQTIPPGIKEE